PAGPEGRGSGGSPSPPAPIVEGPRPGTIRGAAAASTSATTATSPNAQRRLMSSATPPMRPGSIVNPARAPASGRKGQGEEAGGPEAGKGQADRERRGMIHGDADQ